MRTRLTTYCFFRPAFLLALLVLGLGAPREAAAASPPGATNPGPAIPDFARTTNEFSTMATLEDRHVLALGDRLSFSVAEDREDPQEPLEPKPLIITDSGEVELPYLGRFPAAGKTCKRLAYEIKAALEKKYYYQATVMLALDLLTRSGGKVYLVGQVRAGGAVEIPGDERFTVSKAVLRAGGFTEFADQRRVRLTRVSGPGGDQVKRFTVNVSDILEKGRVETDVKLESGDLIFVPSRLINF